MRTRLAVLLILAALVAIAVLAPGLRAADPPPVTTTVVETLIVR